MAETMSNLQGLDARIDAELDTFFRGGVPDGKTEIRRGVPFEVEVGSCRGVGCQGKIVYRLKWQSGSPPFDILMGVYALPTESLSSCSCERCGMMYDTLHPRYRDIFERAYAEFLKGS